MNDIVIGNIPNVNIRLPEFKFPFERKDSLSPTSTVSTAPSIAKAPKTAPQISVFSTIKTTTKTSISSYSSKVAKECISGVQKSSHWIFGVFLINRGVIVANIYIDDGLYEASKYVFDYAQYYLTVSSNAWEGLGNVITSFSTRYAGVGGFVFRSTGSLCQGMKFCLRRVYSAPIYPLLLADFYGNNGRSILDGLAYIGEHNPQLHIDLGIVSETLAEGMKKSLFYIFEPAFKYGSQSHLSTGVWEQYQEHTYNETYVVTLPSGNIMYLPYEKKDSYQFFDYYISYLEEKDGHQLSSFDAIHDYNYENERTKTFCTSYENGEKYTITYQLTKYPVMRMPEGRYEMVTPDGGFEVYKGETYKDLTHRIADMKSLGFSVKNAEDYARSLVTYQEYKADMERKLDQQLLEMTILVEERRQKIQDQIKSRINGYKENNLLVISNNEYMVKNYSAETYNEANKAFLLLENDMVYVHPLPSKDKSYFVYIGAKAGLELALNLWKSKEAEMVSAIHSPQIFVYQYSSLGENEQKIETEGFFESIVFLTDLGVRSQVFWEGGTVTHYDPVTIKPIREEKFTLGMKEALFFEKKSGDFREIIDDNYISNVKLYNHKHGRVSPIPYSPLTTKLFDK